MATSGGTEYRTRFLVTATGVLSVPYFPDVPGREEFRGESFHTGLWPTEPVDFAGKRVAVIGTGSSGVQVIPAIAGEVASLTVYQRTANWCTPLNNAPITAEEQAQLRADFEAIRETLNTSPSGFLHPVHDRKTFDDPTDARLAFFEKMWQSPGFSKLTSNYVDLTVDHAANALWCEFIAAKVRDIVKDPGTAERLIPKDHRFAEKRPPFVTGYYETFNNSNVSLVDLKETPIIRITDAGIETTDGLQEFDIIVWATGFDFGTGALARMGIRGRENLSLEDHWRDGPTTFLGIVTTGFPNLFFPGGPHAAAGNNPRYNGDQVDFVTETLVYLRDHGYDTIEVERRRRRALDQNDRRRRLHVPLRGDQLLLRQQHPGEAAQVSPELRRPSQAPEGDQEGLRQRLRGLRALASSADRSDSGDGVSGEPTIPGRRSGRCGEQEPTPVVLAQPRRQLVQVPHLAQGNAEPEQAEVVDGKEGMPTLVAVRVRAGLRRRSCRPPGLRSGSR